MTTRGAVDSSPWDACIRALLYPVQFERDPLDGIDGLAVMRDKIVWPQKNIQFAGGEGE